MKALVTINIVLRAAMEIGIVLAFGWWGYTIGAGLAMKNILAVVVPAVGFGVWGAVDFRRAGRWSEPLRLVEELLISGLAAGAFYLAGIPSLAWTLAALSATHHVAVYALGQRLLKHES